MIMPMGTSYMRRNYQLLAWVALSNLGLDGAFDHICTIVYNWAKGKCQGTFPVPATIQSVNRIQTDTGKMLGVVYDPNKHFFSLKLSHPDREVAGRYWSVDVELVEQEHALHFAVRQSVSSLKSCKVPIPYSRPTFIKNIALNIGLIDCGKNIAEDVMIVQTEDDVTNLATFLSNLNRQLPVVVISQCNEGDGNNGYLINGQKVAKDLLGYAHVVQLTKESTYMLTELVGADLSVYDGAVRTYYPGLIFDESNKYEHPLVTKWGIWNSSENTAPPFELRLEDYIQQNNGARFIDWEDEGFKFYLQAEQNRLADLQVSEKDVKKLKATYEEQIRQYEASTQEYKAIAESYEADAKAYQRDCDELRKQISALKGLIDVQKAQIHDLRNGRDENIPIGNSYEDMVAWAEKYFPDRLCFLSRARKALKYATYKNIDLVYRCLILLATDYYDFRVGKFDREEFIRRCKKIDAGLDESAAITDVAAGHQGETYYVTYAGKREKLERHLTKGVSRDPSECLRIYFFWDEQNSLVVIGSLTGHLDTRVS